MQALPHNQNYNPSINRWNTHGMAIQNYGKLVKYLDGHRRYFHKVVTGDGTYYTISDQSAGALTINELVNRIQATLISRLTINNTLLVIEQVKDNRIFIPWIDRVPDLPEGYHQITEH